MNEPEMKRKGDTPIKENLILPGKDPTYDRLKKAQARIATLESCLEKAKEALAESCWCGGNEPGVICFGCETLAEIQAIKKGEK